MVLSAEAGTYQLLLAEAGSESLPPLSSVVSDYSPYGYLLPTNAAPGENYVSAGDLAYAAIPAGSYDLLLLDSGGQVCQIFAGKAWRRIRSMW